MDGVFPFFKPPGITSHDAVGICRRLLHERRIGHSGTLDPLAMGVLPIFVGKATRLIEFTESVSKTYVAEGCFGTATDTEDSTGQCIATAASSVEPPSWTALAAAVSSFLGPYEQTPSIYSAIKVNGRRAYELAREGKEVILPSRMVQLYECTLLAYAYPYFTIRVTCSAGTYIRALLRDIAAMVGIPAMMTQLVRTAVGSYTASQAVTGEELAILGESVVAPADSAVMHLPQLVCDASQALAIKQGKQLRLRDCHNLIGKGTRYRLYGPEGFIGIAEETDISVKSVKNLFL